MKIAERIVMVLILFCFIGGGAWIYFSVQYKHQEVVDAVYRGEYEIPHADKNAEVTLDNWREVYPVTIPITIGEVTVDASVADDQASRIVGLSKTPFLPPGVIKLFAFGSTGNHSIWMKDMSYALDIIWVTEEGNIVHIEENVSPDSFPESFSSPIPAWYVVEANAGFVTENNITLEDEMHLVN